VASSMRLLITTTQPPCHCIACYQGPPRRCCHAPPYGGTALSAGGGEEAHADPALPGMFGGEFYLTMRIWLYRELSIVEIMYEVR
jgi:hypothetical protein